MSTIRKFGISITLAALCLCASASQLAAQTDSSSDPATTFATLLNFDSTNGANSSAGMIQAKDGNLYGTTANGGANNDGSVFKITTSGSLTTLYSFCSLSACADGANPAGGVIQATDGNFYGTTELGTIFKITSSGTLTTLNSLDGADGEFPVSGLVEGTDGNLYGTASEGGANSNCSTTLVDHKAGAQDNIAPRKFVSCGTVFKVTLSGTVTTLASLTMASGFRPSAPLLQANDGNFYGTAQEGGTSDLGTIFKVTPGGTLTTLHSFTGPDGEKSIGALIQATDGSLYGTTSFGGSIGGGTVFKITLAGTLTTLASLPYTAGFGPSAGLVQASDGNFYGTTAQNGSTNDGFVFKITPTGALTILHTFDGADGEYSVASLVQATNGTFYGTNYYGASSNCNSGCGTIFSLSVGLAPFVATQPASGIVGAPVNILGTNLARASGVTFDGIPARFKVTSSSEIETSVPAGATTGEVQVITPSGALSSSVPFQVLP
jgi:uncharacterized repeat protein (TIGR03803 family)